MFRPVILSSMYTNGLKMMNYDKFMLYNFMIDSIIIIIIIIIIIFIN
jgi:hypothetical protein